MAKVVKYSDILGIQTIEPMLFKIALGIQDQAVNLAPVDTGQLRNSISIATELREAKFNEAGGELAPIDAKITPPQATDGSAAKIGSALPYAMAVEYGRKDMPGYPMQPYLRPAGQLAKAQIRKESTTAIKAAIKKLAQERLAKRKARGVQ